MRGFLPLLLSLAILCSLVSCHEKPILPPGLMGKWVLTRNGGGDSTHWYYTAYTGSSRILQIQRDNKYGWYNSFSLVESGTYSLSTDTPGTHISNMVITFTHDNSSYKRYYYFLDRELYLYDYSANPTFPVAPIEEYYQKIY